MGHTDKTEKHPEKQLFEQLDHVRAGMLGIEGSHSHMQPMAHIKDKSGAARLWFFTSRAGDLFREMGEASHAHFCVIGKGQDYHACLMGELSENRDRGKIEEYWNDHVAAWFRPSKDDPDIALLAVRPDGRRDLGLDAEPDPLCAGRSRRAKNSKKEPDLGGAGACRLHSRQGIEGCARRAANAH